MWVQHAEAAEPVGEGQHALLPQHRGGGNACEWEGEGDRGGQALGMGRTAERPLACRRDTES